MIVEYADEMHTCVRVVEGTGVRFVPVSDDNADWMGIVASGCEIAPWVPPEPTSDDVRLEAQRRMIALVGARDAGHLAMIIANGSREAIRLLRIKSERAWTPEEASRAAQLEAVDAAIEAIRAASNAMEAAPPHDYAGDARWP